MAKRRKLESPLGLALGAGVQGVDFSAGGKDPDFHRAQDAGNPLAGNINDADGDVMYDDDLDVETADPTNPQAVLFRAVRHAFEKYGPNGGNR